MQNYFKYTFYGEILPRETGLSFDFHHSFTHITSGGNAKINVDVDHDKITACITTDNIWDIYDLRNTVINIIQTYLSIITYAKGYVYEFYISSATNQEDININFGADIPIIAVPRESVDTLKSIQSIFPEFAKENGIYLQRCFNDLSLAIKNPEDVGFYCYRAIEALQKHCAYNYNISGNNESARWKKFREVSKTEEVLIFNIKNNYADPTRHGGFVSITDETSGKILETTWGIVDRYLNSIISKTI